MVTYGGKDVRGGRIQRGDGARFARHLGTKRLPFTY